MTRVSSASPVVVIGAGLAGLAAARHLDLHGIPFVLFEAGPNIAGMAQSFRDVHGFVYDSGAHFITNRLAAALGISAECLDVKRYGESVLIHGKFLNYPFGLGRHLRFARGALQAALRRVVDPPRLNGDAESWFRAQYGRELADQVALPLLEAWAGVPARSLSSIVAAKLRHSAFHTAYLRAVGKVTGRAVSIGYSNEMPENTSVWHVYPQGGIGRACERMAEGLQDRIHKGCSVEEIHVEQNRVSSIRVQGRIMPVAAVISTAPAPILANMVRGSSKLEEVKKFRFRPMIIANLHYGCDGILPDTILWLPERKYPFFRATETTRSMPWLAPAGSSSIACDIGDDIGGRFWNMEDQQIGELCANGIADLFPSSRAFYQGCRIVRIPAAYPLFLNEYEEARRNFAEGTGIDGLYSIGRNGEFAHLLMEDVYWRTLRKVNGLIAEIVVAKPSAAADPSDCSIGTLATAG